ncbi:MAG: site-2 protease family protein [Anaerolineaceae bacterium]|nr:site-2 protease family protein [Anaerolineaceae bacterium]
MQLFQAPPITRFDLNFSLFGFQVRVSPFFWLIALLFASGSRNLLHILLLIIVIFLSILLHELGHAFTLRSMEQESQIVLYQGGGLTIPEERSWGYSVARVGLSPAQDVLVAVSGAGAGFLMVLLLTIIVYFFGGTVSMAFLFGFIPFPQLFFPLGGSILSIFLGAFVSVNIFWGVFNLLPVNPLDGSTVMRHILQHFDPVNGYRKTLWVSVICGALVAFASLVWGQLYIAFLFGYLAFQSFQAVRR